MSVLVVVTVALLQGAACSAAQHRQFDFWIGDWDVTDTRGQRAGTNRIESINGGCGLAESWEGANGSRGRSLNAYDPGDNRWHQTWTDNAGTVLMIAGGIVNGEMVMEGERRLPDGTHTLDRITWTPNKDGTIRQRWQSSRDRGMRWTTVFDGLYRKRSPEAARTIVWTGGNLTPSRWVSCYLAFPEPARRAEPTSHRFSTQ